MAHVKIETIKNGPYIVTGEAELIDADGNKFPAEKRMALCRCELPPRNLFAMARTRQLASKRRRKRCRNQRNNFVIPSEVEESLA
jgi:CDGSH iron-sulfur domain-containing protein 3